MKPTQSKGRVLIIAGSDSGGGAGLQADLKTVSMLGGYAATAVTAVTVQNTRGVTGIHAIPEAIVAAQVIAVLSDMGADALKTGMLLNAAIIETVAEALAPWPNIPLILDPVMVAKGGAPLLDPEAVSALKERLIPRALLLTPNIPEAEALLGAGPTIRTLPEMVEAGHALLALGAESVLLKGGHLPGSSLTDVLIMQPPGSRMPKVVTFSSTRIETVHTHGTGCTLASGIAVGIAQGLALEEAVRRAHAYVQEAIRTAPGLGGGHGPLNHGHPLKTP